jgi:hypothetical protein
MDDFLVQVSIIMRIVRFIGVLLLLRSTSVFAYTVRWLGCVPMALRHTVRAFGPQAFVALSNPLIRARHRQVRGL